METNQISNSISEQALVLIKMSSELKKKAIIFLETLDSKEWTIETFIESMKLANTLSSQAYENYALLKSLKE